MRSYPAPDIVQYCRKADKEGILTRAEMAMLFDITPTSIGRWINGKARGSTCKIGRNEKAIQEAVESSTDKCVLWPYAQDKDGYGKITSGRAHREVCLRAHGPQPLDKPCVLHSCDTPRCVNPRHLNWGTPKENALERSERNPKSFAKGEATGHTKLNSADIPIIRKLVQKGLSDGQIARKYKVIPETIRNVRLKKTWKHIP